MAYHDSACPCGGKKPTDTMLCDDCLAAFAGHPSLVAFNDGNTPTSYRRTAAIVLLSLARRRKTAREPYLTVRR